MFTVDRVECVRNNQILFSEVSFSLKPGEVKQIKGENGVGKTTLLRCLSGLSVPYSGEIKWQNNPVYLNDQFNANRIYIGHKNAIKASLTVEENLRLTPALPNLDSADIPNVLKQIGLELKTNSLGGMLSAGQKQRLALTKLLLSNSQLWILDEPFNALDNDGLTMVQDIMQAHLSRRGMIIFTAHQAELINVEHYSTLTLVPKRGHQEVYSIDF